jgi:hypothetical protein
MMRGWQPALGPQWAGSGGSPARTRGQIRWATTQTAGASLLARSRCAGLPGDADAVVAGGRGVWPPAVEAADQDESGKGRSRLRQLVRRPPQAGVARSLVRKLQP